MYPVPVHLPVLADIVAVAAGFNHSLALDASGHVWSMGENSGGQLGRGDPSVDYVTPEPIPGLADVVAIAAGLNHSLALKSDGTVWSFGENFNGQLGRTDDNGNPSHPAHPTPAQIPGLADVVAIAAGSNHSLALKSDGTAWAFGNNDGGQLGNPTNSCSNQATPTPTQIGTFTDVTAISAGYEFSLVLHANHTVSAFGNNASGQLGSNDLGNPVDGTCKPNSAHPTPATISGLTNVRGIEAGDTFAFALDGPRSRSRSTRSPSARWPIHPSPSPPLRPPVWPSRTPRPAPPAAWQAASSPSSPPGAAPSRPARPATVTTRRHQT